MNNALESWAMAIHYCDEIMAGKATLMHRKYFVASLHNAVELFVKQRMLNICDYRVAEVRNNGANGEPLKSYLSAQDLNDYFDNVCKTPNVMDKFYTIEFSKIRDIQKEIFSEFDSQNPNNKFKMALNTLQKLRNSETHFFIDADDFLNDTQFQDLYNLMVDFYAILKFYSLLPFWGEPFGEYQRFAFDRLYLQNFSFRKQIKSSEFVVKLKTNIEGKIYPAGGGDEAYTIAKDIVEYCDAYSEADFDAIWSYIQMLLKYQLLDIEDAADEEYVDGQKMYGSPYREYRVKI